MKLIICLDGDFKENPSIDLHELANDISDSGHKHERTEVSVPGGKSALMIGLSILGVTLGTVNACLGTINFWKNKKNKKYNVEVFIDGRTIDISTPLNFKKLEEHSENSLVVVQIKEK